MYNYTCLHCQKQFFSPYKNRKYCNIDCHVKNMGGYRPERECIFCKNIFYIKARNDRRKQSIYCSKLCRYKYENDPINQLDRLRKSLERNVIKKSDNECWGWKIQEERGYGQAKFMGKHISASKASYIVYKGEIPEGMFVCHSCDVRECINPLHLWLGTPKDNQQDMIKKGRNRNSKGSDHGQSKLTEEQVIDIRKRLLNGESGISITKLFNISSVLVSMIKKNKRWKHI